jgi:hypothetical protein
MTNQESTSNGRTNRDGRTNNPRGASKKQLEAMRKKAVKLNGERLLERQEAFLHCLNRHDGVIAHCLKDKAMQGMNYRTLRRWREDPEFLQKYEEVINEGLDRLAAVATRLATGTFNPDLPPDAATLRFLLGHLHPAFKKESEAVKIDINLAGRQEEATEDLKRLLEDQQKKYIESTAKSIPNKDRTKFPAEGVGGTVTTSGPGVRFPHTDNDMLRNKKNDSP